MKKLQNTSDKKTYIPNVVDLFSGAGGMSEGFTEAGFNVILGVEFQEKFSATFKKNHPDSHAICGDIREISVDMMRGIIGDRNVDVVVGGPPCQGFSVAGKRDPNDPRNALFMEYVRVVEGLRPKYFLMENVRGILSMQTSSGESVIGIIKNEFKRLGYGLVGPKVLLAADYGVPQKRQRMFLIGVRHGCALPVFPSPTHHNPQKEQGNLFYQNTIPWVTIGDVVMERKDVPQQYFHSDKMTKWLLDRKEKNKETTGFGCNIIRLNEPSNTITARYYKDGADALMVYEDGTSRMLTERECARVQSFPEHYEFCGGKKATYMQIGNAVPPRLAKAIAMEIKKALFFDN